MKQIILLAFTFFILSANIVCAQKKGTKISIGKIKEFSGTVASYYMYDGDIFFTLKDKNNVETQFYFRAGSCHGDGDPYNIVCDIEDNLMSMIENINSQEDNSSKIKVHVVAKYSYGLFCGNCDDCVREKQKIWRPTKVTQAY